MASIVILGSSFGGLTAAFELKKLLGDKADITLLSEDDRFVFLPSLPWLIMGWRKPEDITLSVREILERKKVKFFHEPATHIEPESLKVHTPFRELPFDYLIISTGPYLSFEDVPGLGPQKGFTDCTLTLAHALRTHLSWERLLEEPGPIILGAAQGVSCFGPSYELAFEMDTELRKRKIRHKVPILYLSSEPYAGHFGIGGLRNSQRFMEDEFANREIKYIVNQAIDEIVPNEIRLKDGSKLPFKFSVIIPPFKGVPAVSSLGNQRGFIPVDEYYRHTKYKNIYAIGVAMAIASPETTPVPTGVPKTGHMTVTMAKTAAAAIASEVNNKPLPSFQELSVACLMDMGNTAAYMKAMPVLPPRQKSVLKGGIHYKWLKLAFERYFLWKIKNGATI